MSTFNFNPIAKKQIKIDYSDTDSVGTESSSSSSLEDESKEELPRPILKNLDAYSSDFALPEMDQCIVRVTKVKKRGVVQIVKDNGMKYSIRVPDRLIDRIYVKNYLLIQPAVYGSPNRVEIVRVIDRPYKRFYEANDVWPVKFVDADVGIIGIAAAKETEEEKKEKMKAKKKKPSKPAAQAIQSTGKEKARKPKKKHVKGGEFESVSESDSNDSENTRMEKRRKRLAILGSDIIEPCNDNTTVTSAVVTSREAIVKDRDEMPPLPEGVPQPWEAILQKKEMSQRQKQKYIEKQMAKKLRKTKRAVNKHIPIADHDLPCGAVTGQVMTPWEDLLKRHKSYKHLDKVED